MVRKEIFGMGNRYRNLDLFSEITQLYIHLPWQYCRFQNITKNTVDAKASRKTNHIKKSGKNNSLVLFDGTWSGHKHGFAHNLSFFVPQCRFAGVHVHFDQLGIVMITMVRVIMIDIYIFVVVDDWEVLSEAEQKCLIDNDRNKILYNY